MQKNFLYIFATCIALLLASVALNILLIMGRIKREQNPVSDTVRITVVDTIAYRHPVLVDSVVLRYETEPLPRVKETGNSLTRPMHSICTDSVLVKIPITQKRYADSTYTVWVSGYHPALDSISVYPRHEVTTITNMIPQKLKRWGVGIHAGYGITPKHGVQPYIGIGVQYNLLSF